MLILTTSLLFAGCESAPTALEQNFGSSVRNMIELQSAQPGYQGHGLDGRKSEAVLEVYRAEVGDPKQVDQEIIQIKLGK
jgi:starvation-inducible outer membrane lipoprotein